MRTIALTLAASLCVAGCSADTSEETASEGEDAAEYTIDEESGEQAMSITTAEGTSSMRSGPGVEPDLPEGWSLYPDAVIENAINVDDGDEGGTMVTMLADAPVDDIISFYRAQADATGYAIELELNTADSRIIGGKSDTGQFSLSVVPGRDGEPARVQLTIGTDPTR